MSSRKNPVRFPVDFEHQQIIGSETSLNKAKRPGSDEYNELCKLMAAHPTFTVVKRETARSKSKQTYKNLSFSFIEKYISTQSRSTELMQEYNQVKITALSLGMSVYPYTKRWFLKKFSDKNGLFDMQAAEELINAGLAAAQVEEPITKAEKPTKTQVVAEAQIEESTMPQAEAVA